ncbi:MAG TPA: histidine phosphatase family protein [Vicinamibacterales bacterium]|nr:histidine phosphatase family protein [Vicinamibacterales bacterium]
MIPRTLFCVICALAFPANVFAQGTIFVVRHAERADTTAGAPATMAADPDLSESGRARAASLASMLKDAHIGAIFVTEYKRTQQTAAPLAKALGITPVVIAAKDTAGLTARLKRTNGNALVVGHSNSVPDIITALGIRTPVSVDDTEFDNLFIVTPQSPPQVIQLRYR